MAYPRSIEDLAAELEGMSSLVGILAGIVTADPEAYSRHADPPTADEVKKAMINLSVRLNALSDELSEISCQDYDALMHRHDA